MFAVAMEAYNTTAYNCTLTTLHLAVFLNRSVFTAMLHIASMQAALALAIAVGDTLTATLANVSLTTAQQEVFSVLWNTTYSYFRAYTGGDAIMVVSSSPSR